MKVENNFNSTFTLEKQHKSSNKEINFSEFLKNAVYSVSDLDKNAEEVNTKFISGEIDNIHDVMIASQKADIALQSFIEVKNKVIDAYKEIMRMQI